MQFTLSNSVKNMSTVGLVVVLNVLQISLLEYHPKQKFFLIIHIYIKSEQINVNKRIARLELEDYLSTFALVLKIKIKISKIPPNLFKQNMKNFYLNIFFNDLNLKFNETNFEDFSIDENFENFLKYLLTLLILLNP